MTDKVQKICEEVERLRIELIQEKENGFGSDADDACILELQNVLTYIDSLQEEPVSDDLEDAAKDYSNNLDNIYGSIGKQTRNAFKAGAEWQKKHLWRDADGDDLPEIDREVVALTQPYPDDEHLRVVFAHRPSKYTTWIERTGEKKTVEVERYDKGEWNIPNAKYWLDVKLPKEIEL